MSAPLFYYVRTRRQSAVKLALNMVVLPLLLGTFWYFGNGKPGFDETFRIAVYGVAVVELILVGIVIWLLLNPSRFEVWLSKDRFSIQHPLFSEYRFGVSPAAIVKIENIVDRNGYKTIVMRMRNGAHHQICPNYAFSREALYRQLRTINPNIQVPKRPGYFSRRSRNSEASGA